MNTRPLSSKAALRRVALATTVACLLCASPLLAASPTYLSLSGVTAESFQKWLDDAKAMGYEPRYINGFRVGDHAEFAGVAVKDDDVHNFESRFDVSPEDFKKESNKLAKKQFHPFCISSYLDGDKVRYAAVWIESKKYGQSMKYRLAMKADDYEDTARTMHKGQFEPVNVTAYTDPDDGKIRISAVFDTRAGRDWDIRFDMNTDQYSDAVDKWKSMGLRPRSVTGYETPAGPRFLASAVKEDAGEWVERHGMTGPKYQIEFDKKAKEGFVPICISGYREGRDVRFAVIWANNK